MGVWIETRAFNRSCIFARSHPSWVCGLKPVRVWKSAKAACHTLHGCVDWNLVDVIYLCDKTGHTLHGCVDWNSSSGFWQSSLKSHPSCVCGLKQATVDKLICAKCHTLHGCVDWNSHSLSLMYSSLKSHPSWVCGLKPRKPSKALSSSMSHPSWVCGLKRCRLRQPWMMPASHPSWVCGLKRIYCRTFRCCSSRHTLHGCVDWNLKRLRLRELNSVTPFMGVWIETP